MPAISMSPLLVRGLTLERTYHTTFANWLKMSLVNAVATLT